MKARRWIMPVFVAAFVAGCHGAQPKADQPAVGAPNVADPPPVSATPTPPSAMMVVPTAAEPCDKQSLAYLIGKPRGQIPVPVDPSRRRVACTTCPVTEDYRADRTDILFDAQTGLVTALKCG